MKMGCIHHIGDCQCSPCLTVCDSPFCFASGTMKEIVSMDYMERIMNEENDRDHNVEGDAVEGPVACVDIEEVLQALNEMKTEKDPGPSGVSLELNVVSSRVGIQVMAEICQRVLDGFGMPVEWALSIVVLIFKGNDGIRNCSCY